LAALIERRRSSLQRRRDAGQLDKESRSRALAEIQMLEQYQQKLVQGEWSDAAAAMEQLKGLFRQQVEQRSQLGDDTGAMFDNAFRYLEETLGDSQEMVIFVTEITAGYDTSWYVENFGCDAYFRHNRELLFDDKRNQIQRELEKVQTNKEQ